MKTKILILLLSACCLLSCTDGLWNAIEDLNKKYENLDDRVSRLEELCKEMNTNIAALQTLVKVMLGNDYIVSITPIMKEDKEIGYVITFAIHDPITIYHGQNGADGKDGKDGQDGVTPLISVALDSTDNAYYWTLNGDWLLDANGNRIPLTSRDGRDGQDGQDGADGITPQLKIENGYWYVSTDNGVTWKQLGKATGETGAAGKDGRDGRDGVDGQDGQDGQDGDSMFQSVTQDDDFVYFTLANGTVLKISKYKDDTVQIVDGAIMAEFSVSSTMKVYFSQGNLLKKEISGTTEYWFADKQDSIPYGGSFNWSTGLGTNIIIQNGGGQNNAWRMMTDIEWNYINNHSKHIYVKIYPENGGQEVSGCVIFPDNYHPIPLIDDLNLTYEIYETMWNEWKRHGVIFLYPGIYWTSTQSQHYGPYFVRLSESYHSLSPTTSTTYSSSWSGYARLVKNVQ